MAHTYIYGGNYINDYVVLTLAEFNYKITDEYIEKFVLDESYKDKTIALYDDRINHIERHREDFTNPLFLDIVFRDLSLIVSNPDFISEDKKNNSLQIVKKMEDNVLVAVRISSGPILKIKTIYPINETKYNNLKTNKL